MSFENKENSKNTVEPGRVESHTQKKFIEYANRILEGVSSYSNIKKTWGSEWVSGIEVELAKAVQDRLSELPVEGHSGFLLSIKDKIPAEIMEKFSENIEVSIKDKITSVSLESKKSNETISIDLIKSEEGFRGSIMDDSGRSIGHITIGNLENKQSYIKDIQIGYNEEAPRNKGFGLKAYKKIIERLSAAGNVLVSTNYNISHTSISPQALRVWEKLEREGFAEKTGTVEALVLDRFTGDSEVRIIPTYSSILK